MAYNNKNTTRLQPTLLALAVSACLASPAWAFQQEPAQAAETNNKGELETIQVTARRTAENLQTVPVAVTSLGAEELKQKGIENLVAVQQQSPNTTLQISRGPTVR